jgi:hemerythrin superfamily protein
MQHEAKTTSHKDAGGKDVISFLKGQHKQIKGLFEDVISARGSERERIFTDLKKLMSAHEAAEEKIVHPAAKVALKDGDAEVAARLAEETEAKRTIAALEKLDVRSEEFEGKIRKLQGAVLAHASSEEKEEFDELATKLDASKLREMGAQVVAAEADAAKS